MVEVLEAVPGARDTAPAIQDALRLELELLRARDAAVGRTLAVIEFELDGTIRTANGNFLAVMGDRLEEVRGRHHRMYVEPAYADSPDDRAFWAALAAGRSHQAEFMRWAKGGREVWLQAAYPPILDASGRPCAVVEVATDATAARLAARREADPRRKVAAAARSLAAAAGELLALSGRLATGSSATSGQAEKVASAATQIKAGMLSVASATEEMSSTVRNVAGNAAEASTGVGEVVADISRVAQSTNEADPTAAETQRDARRIEQLARELDGLGDATA